MSAESRLAKNSASHTLASSTVRRLAHLYKENMADELRGHVINCNFFSAFCLLDVVVEDKDLRVILFKEVEEIGRGSRAKQRVRELRREIRVGDLVSASGKWVEDAHESARQSVRGTRRLLVVEPPVIVKKRALQVQGVNEVRERLYLPRKASQRAKKGRRKNRSEAVLRAEKVGGAAQGVAVAAAAAAAAAATLNAGVDGSKARHRGCARKRGEVFASWVISQVGREALRSGGGVLDVAGGGGHLSLAFALAGIEATLVDPRDTAGILPRRDRKVLKRAIKAGGGGRGHVQPVPFNVDRSFFGGRIEGADNAFSGGSDAIAATRAELVESASIILALHPDEATESAVDMAIKHGKPWAVVPCCIFARLFPDRRLRSGGRVLSHEDFLKYFCEKHPGARIAKLHEMYVQGKARRKPCKTNVTHEALLAPARRCAPSHARWTGKGRMTWSTAFHVVETKERAGNNGIVFFLSRWVGSRAQACRCVGKARS